jgi:hypothetical protein
MPLGPPYFISGSSSASYDSSISSLLTRLPDNNQNLILAKDVRDPIWTLWNQIQNVASQSGSFSQAITYTTATPSSVTIGGILEGMTFSNESLQGLFDLMLHPFVPAVVDLDINVGERQFGNNGTLNLSYHINRGSSLISTITFNGPSNPIPPSIPSGNDPDTGFKFGIVPTYSLTPVLSKELVFTMSVVTQDLMTYSATASTIYKHKRYYGPLTIPMGFTPSIPSSVTAVQSYLTDSVIKGLSFSELSTNVYFSKYMPFVNQYFVFAVPTLFGEPPLQGFHMDFLFSTDYTKIKSGVTFSNEYGYLAPYDVWISNFKLNENPVLVGVQNPDSFNNNFIVPTDDYYLVGPMGPTGLDGSPIDINEIAFGTGTGVTSSKYFEFNQVGFNLLGSNGSTFSSATSSAILGGQYHNLSNSTNSVILGGSNLTLNNENDVVYVSKLKIATASNDNGLSDILVRDSNGDVKYRDVSTISSNVKINDIYYVSKDGNNASGQKGVITKPYKDIKYVVNLATSGDYIHVYPGTYDEYDIPTKSNLTIYLEDGVKIVPTFNSGKVAIFSDLVLNQPALNFRILGYGELISNGYSGNDTTSLVASFTNSKYYVEAKKVRSMEAWNQNGAYIYVKNAIIDFEAVAYNGGELYLENCSFINKGNILSPSSDAAGNKPYKITYKNCYFERNAINADYTTSYGVSASHVFYINYVSNTNINGSILFDDCDFVQKMTNNDIIYIQNINYDTRALLEFNNCKFYNVDTSKKSIVLTTNAYPFAPYSFNQSTSYENGNLKMFFFNNISNVDVDNINTIYPMTNQIPVQGVIVNQYYKINTKYI